MKKSDIIEKQFNRAFWGYDIVEVDQFLDDVEATVRQLRERLSKYEEI